MIRIDDPGDDRLSDYRDLTDAGLRRIRESPSGVAPHGLFVAEGTFVLERLLQSGHHVRSILIGEHRVEPLAPVLARTTAPVYVARRDVLAGITGFDVHRGVLAAADRWPLPSLTSVIERARAIAVLEQITDHENLGAVFRSAAALGVDAVVLCPRACDPLYRRSVRVSMGTVLTLPWTRAQRWPADLDQLAPAGFRLAGLTTHPAAVALDGGAGPDAGKIAVLLGSEATGLTAEARARCDLELRIPMRAGVDSLNLAAAAAIAFHRFGRT